MKAALLVARILRDAGVKHVFCVSGGASLHLIHGIANTEGIDYVCPQTEQAAGFAADAYARLTGLGCAIATSGPGATNLITAIASAFYDSVPIVFITGQVTTFRRAKGFPNPPRQYGFQETPIVEMVMPITKYAVTVEKPERLGYELQVAIAQAKAGRPGPTLVDICDDVQRAEIP